MEVCGRNDGKLIRMRKDIVLSCLSNSSIEEAQLADNLMFGVPLIGLLACLIMGFGSRQCISDE